MRKTLIGVCCLALSSCTWVKITPEGESVRLVQSGKTVEPCKKLGEVNTKVVSKMVFSRDKEKVAKELADLARNEAVLMEGDTIVPISDIVEGRRSFGVYQCFPTPTK
jgi:hypothetical protein